MAQLKVEEGDTVILEYPVDGVTFPEWRGPPDSMIITIGGVKTGTISPKAPAASRLKFDRNNRDLILSNAVIGDSGEYTCSSQGKGDHAITLTVNRRKHHGDEHFAAEPGIFYGTLAAVVVAVVAGGVVTSQLVKSKDRWKILLVTCFCCLTILFVGGLLLLYFLCLKDCNAENC